MNATALSVLSAKCEQDEAAFLDELGERLPFVGRMLLDASYSLETNREPAVMIVMTPATLHILSALVTLMDAKARIRKAGACPDGE